MERADLHSLPPSLNIIGAGKVGRTLGRLWHEQDILVIGDILNRSTTSTASACAFIGAGRPAQRIDELQPADVWMIASGDDSIAACCNALAEQGLFRPRDIVFHCSGALSSDVLQAARSKGAVVASVHPVRSFARPEDNVAVFAGTWCGVEGDTEALHVLREIFSCIGARFVELQPDAKTIYHAAAVFASNYLVTLMDVATQAYARAGVPPETALMLMEPLVRGTVDNVFKTGPRLALTGPIARGDMATVERQQAALSTWNEEYAALYEQFMRLTVDLARRQA